MMTITHAFVGALLGAATAFVAPEWTAAGIVVGFVGGSVPDLDLVATHRRTLHFPIAGPVVATIGSVPALVVGSPATVLLAVFLLAAAVHCFMDVFGGGVEVRPWEATSDRGVYDHVRDRWIPPRRWIRYSGAPEDFLLAAVAGLPVISIADGTTSAVLAGVLVVSGLFVAVRKRLGGVSERLFADAVED